MPDWLINKDVESGLIEQPQLFDLSNDPGEQIDLAKDNADLVAVMERALDKILQEE